MPYIPSQDYLKSLRDVAPNWRWVVALPTLAGSLSATNPSSAGNFPVAYDGLVAVPTVPFGIAHRIDAGPTVIGSEQRFYGGRSLKFPRHVDNPNISITFYEDDQYSVFNYFKTWQNLIVDANGNYGAPANYKFPISLFAFDVVSSTISKMIEKFNGCWPPNLGQLSYNYDQSGPVTMAIDFCVDSDNASFTNTTNQSSP